MQNISKKVMSSIREKKFEKKLAVANLANGVDFLDEINYYNFYDDIFLFFLFMV